MCKVYANYPGGMSPKWFAYRPYPGDMLCGVFCLVFSPGELLPVKHRGNSPEALRAIEDDRKRFVLKSPYGHWFLGRSGGETPTLRNSRKFDSNDQAVWAKTFGYEGWGDWKILTISEVIAPQLVKCAIVE